MPPMPPDAAVAAAIAFPERGRREENFACPPKALQRSDQGRPRSGGPGPGGPVRIRLDMATFGKPSEPQNFKSYAPGTCGAPDTRRPAALALAAVALALALALMLPPHAPPPAHPLRPALRHALSRNLRLRRRNHRKDKPSEKRGSG